MTDFALTITASPIDVALDASPIDVELAIPGPQGPAGSSGSSLADGDKGDVTVSGTGSTWTVDNDAITYAKMQNVSAASRLIGRGSAAGAGDPQEITLGAGLAWSGTSFAFSPGTAGIVAEDVEFSPSGGLAATDVQTAIEELDTEKAALAGAEFTGTVKVPNTTGLAIKAATGSYSTFITFTQVNTADRAIVFDLGTGASSPILAVLGSATIGGGTHSGTNTGDQTSVTGNAGTVTVTDAGGDTTNWPMLATSQTGNMAPATDAGLTYNATTNALSATTFAGDLSGTINTATTATTQSASDSSTKVATTAFVHDAAGHRERDLWFNASGVRVVLTNQASGAQFFGNTVANIVRADLTHYTQFRLVGNVQTGSASANTPKLRARYKTSFGTPTIGEYAQDLGTSEASISLASAGLIETSWIDLASSAKADVFVTIEQIGGDAAADPAIGMLVIQLRGNA